MTRFVLDASVAGKWALPPRDEPLKPQAFRLLERYRDRDIQFIVPDIFWAEVGNVFCKAVRQGRHSQAAANTAMAGMIERKFPTIPSLLLLPEAWDIATAHSCPVYDSLYVALARMSGAELIAADERLANAMAARFPVKWLGAFY